MKDYEKYGIPDDLFLDYRNIKKYLEYTILIEINDENDFEISADSSAVLEDSSLALWFAAEYWTTLEASLLIAGLNPLHSNLYAIAGKFEYDRDGLITDAKYRWINETQLSAAKDYFFIFKRSLLNPQANPSKWLSFYLEKIFGKSVQHEFIDNYGKKWLKIFNVTSSEFNALEAINKPESTRKTENLLRALTAIAIDEYGYKPESLKSNAPQDIANAMSNQGVIFDAKTIRNWLREGAALLTSKRDED